MVFDSGRFACPVGAQKGPIPHQGGAVKETPLHRFVTTIGFDEIAKLLSRETIRRSLSRPRAAYRPPSWSELSFSKSTMALTAHLGTS